MLKICTLKLKVKIRHPIKCGSRSGSIIFNSRRGFAKLIWALGLLRKCNIFFPDLTDLSLKKSYPFLYSMLLYIFVQDFLDIQYILFQFTIDDAFEESEEDKVYMPTCTAQLFLMYHIICLSVRLSVCNSKSNYINV